MRAARDNDTVSSPTTAPNAVASNLGSIAAAGTGVAGAGSANRGSPTVQLASPFDPYAAILELAERELQLARDGRIEDLRSLGAEWDELTAGLPACPPAYARGPLQRAAVLHERTSATLMCLREAMLCDMRTTAQASRAAHGYARQGTRRVHRVDHSA